VRCLSLTDGTVFPLLTGLILGLTWRKITVGDGVDCSACVGRCEVEFMLLLITVWFTDVNYSCV